MNESLDSGINDAHNELKESICKLLFDFTFKYAAPGSVYYPYVFPIMTGMLVECLEDVYNNLVSDLKKDN